VSSWTTCLSRHARLATALAAVCWGTTLLGRVAGVPRGRRRAIIRDCRGRVQQMAVVSQQQQLPLPPLLLPRCRLEVLPLVPPVLPRRQWRRRIVAVSRWSGLVPTGPPHSMHVAMMVSMAGRVLVGRGTPPGRRSRALQTRLWRSTGCPLAAVSVSASAAAAVAAADTRLMCAAWRRSWRRPTPTTRA
jgi:hypothetical protein